MFCTFSVNVDESWKNRYLVTYFFNKSFLKSKLSKNFNSKTWSPKLIFLKKSKMKCLWSVKSWLYYEKLLSNSVDPVKNLQEAVQQRYNLISWVPFIYYVSTFLGFLDPPSTLYWNWFCIVIWGCFSQNDRFVQNWFQRHLWYHIRSGKLPRAIFVTKKLLETDRIG